MHVCVCSYVYVCVCVSVCERVCARLSACPHVISDSALPHPLLPLPLNSQSLERFSSRPMRVSPPLSFKQYQLNISVEDVIRSVQEERRVAAALRRPTSAGLSAPMNPQQQQQQQQQQSRAASGADPASETPQQQQQQQQNRASEGLSGAHLESRNVETTSSSDSSSSISKSSRSISGSHLGLQGSREAQRPASLSLEEVVSKVSKCLRCLHSSWSMLHAAAVRLLGPKSSCGTFVAASRRGRVLEPRTAHRLHYTRMHNTYVGLARTVYMAVCMVYLLEIPKYRICIAHICGWKQCTGRVDHTCRAKLHT